jgi:hypothetical protein
MEMSYLMANKVIITESLLDTLGSNMRYTHNLDHNPTLTEMAMLALEPTGTDISDTTVEAPDVLSGKFFYNAEGVKTEGSMETYTGENTTPDINLGQIRGINFKGLAEASFDQGSFVVLKPSYKIVTIDSRNDTFSSSSSTPILIGDNKVFISYDAWGGGLYLGILEYSDTAVKLLSQSSHLGYHKMTSSIRLTEDIFLVSYTYSSSTYILLTKVNADYTFTTLNKTQISSSQGYFLSNILDLGNNIFAVMYCEEKYGTKLTVFKVNKDYDIVSILDDVILSSSRSAIWEAQKISLIKKEDKIYAFYCHSISNGSATYYAAILNVDDTEKIIVEKEYKVGSLGVAGITHLNEHGDFVGLSNTSDGKLKSVVVRIDEDKSNLITKEIFSNSTISYAQYSTCLVPLGNDCYYCVASSSDKSNNLYLVYSIASITYEGSKSHYSNTKSKGSYPTGIFDGKRVFLAYSYGTTNNKQFYTMIVKPTKVAKYKSTDTTIFGVNTTNAIENEIVEVTIPESEG